MTFSLALQVSGVVMIGVGFSSIEGNVPVAKVTRLTLKHNLTFYGFFFLQYLWILLAILHKSHLSWSNEGMKCSFWLSPEFILKTLGLKFVYFNVFLDEIRKKWLANLKNEDVQCFVFTCLALLLFSFHSTFHKYVLIHWISVTCSSFGVSLER